MCFGSSGGGKELEVAREQAAKAKAQADIALAQAKEAVAAARQSATPAADQEKAQRAAEQAMRTRVAEGTYTKTFRIGAGLTAPMPSIGYAHLTGMAA